MITVKVSYTVKPEFVSKNKENISVFLNDFKKMDPSDFKYSVYLKDDNITFVHLSTYKNEIIQNEVLQVASFKEFQKQRDESGLNNSHKVEVLHLFDSSFPTL
jgi:hypothetical protein